MSELTLLLLVAGLTAGSRVAALALLPTLRGRALVVAERLPAPLFAALAALTLADADSQLPDPAVLAGAACALLATRTRSLPITLVAGASGFLLVNQLV